MASIATSSIPRRGRQAIEDSKLIRRSALQYKVHYDTTLNGGFATAMALNADPTEQVISVQEMHAQIKAM
ncbi:Carbamoyl-phosphate synthase large chain [Pantoea agglomerans]|uniref:Carbamoyl-phosphate synthase large chain n=1 Tax=Enterobacter agglomerans TaxID=549 RepID=A0A379AKZ5_ENTAG|nr:Carbamoyl-phosphate synthase large chain [Pantoea agglomerans]